MKRDREIMEREKGESSHSGSRCNAHIWKNDVRAVVFNEVSMLWYLLSPLPKIDMAITDLGNKA